MTKLDGLYYIMIFLLDIGMMNIYFKLPIDAYIVVNAYPNEVPDNASFFLGGGGICNYLSFDIRFVFLLIFEIVTSVYLNTEAIKYNMAFSDFNECESNPCQNGGTCTDHLNQYSCRCAHGYTGVNCQTGQLYGTFVIATLIH